MTIQYYMQRTNNMTMMWLYSSSLSQYIVTKTLRINNTTLKKLQCSHVFKRKEKIWHEIQLRQKILPVLAHHFNDHDYHTLALEYVVNFIISMGVLYSVCTRKQARYTFMSYTTLVYNPRS
jgi:hypothetical protein